MKRAGFVCVYRVSVVVANGFFNLMTRRLKARFVLERVCFLWGRVTSPTTAQSLSYSQLPAAHPSTT